MTKGRLEAFSDGVIAIIITITILLIEVPEGEGMSSLLHILPLALSYLVSFMLISAQNRHPTSAGRGSLAGN